MGSCLASVSCLRRKKYVIVTVVDRYFFYLFTLQNLLGYYIFTSPQYYAEEFV